LQWRFTDNTVRGDTSLTAYTGLYTGAAPTGTAGTDYIEENTRLQPVP
jgi:hypothetical protein